jgi:hypothetical protein
MAMSKLSLKDRVPFKYDQQKLIEIVRRLEEQVNQLTEGRASAYHGAMSAAPTAGTWVVGDWVKNSAPAALGYFGWVCVTTGTPGTWKGFGVIQA